MQSGTQPAPYIIALIIAVSVLQLAIKAVALWRSSQLKQRNWFIALFILIPFNDLGVAELIYLFWFAKKRLTIQEVKSWIVRKKT